MQWISKVPRWKCEINNSRVNFSFNPIAFVVHNHVLKPVRKQKQSRYWFTDCWLFLHQLLIITFWTLSSSSFFIVICTYRSTAVASLFGTPMRMLVIVGILGPASCFHRLRDPSLYSIHNVGFYSFFETCGHRFSISNNSGFNSIIHACAHPYYIERTLLTKLMC